MTRSVLASAIAAFLLIAPTTGSAGNNLNLIPPKGWHYGIVKRSGTKIVVMLERARSIYYPGANDSLLTIDFIDPATDVGPPVFNAPGGTPFNEVYPNGAYRFQDLGHDLLASRGCWQVGAIGGGWDGSTVLCDPAFVESILVKPYTGNDRITAEDGLAIPVDVKCHKTKTSCGLNCLVPSAAMCCDTTTGCYTAPGGDCSVDCPPMP